MICGLPPRGRGRRDADGAGQRGERATPARAGTTPRRTWRPERRPGYPRAGGDDPLAEVEGNLSYGLPPRGRGRLQDVPRYERLQRATPARAGTTSNSIEASARSAGYPRAGGDDTGGTGTRRPCRGLPPRGRGRLRLLRHRPAVVRATPARAGTTRPRPPAASAPAGYPRAGGDDVDAAAEPPWMWGLPPRGRGRPGGRTRPGRPGRATPARAGTTSPPKTPPPPTRGYPRAGGDDRKSARTPNGDYGLPPRGRGRRGAGAVAGRERRATPARAGTTSPATCSRRCVRGFPRAGGDDRARELPPASSSGLPPRGRGRPCNMISDPVPMGATPARAGTTSPSRARRGRSGGYPRAGGDDSSTQPPRRPTIGLPPRGRGRLRQPRDRTGVPRATPARAGTTSGPSTTGAHSAGYPRAGGDDPLPPGEIVYAMGLPPRGRGRLCLTLAREGTERATPQSGLPPRGRGRHQQRRIGGADRGATPARAGTTRRRRPAGTPGWGYPRAGGDDRDARPDRP